MSAADPAVGAVAPTLDTDFTIAKMRALYVGTGGDVAVVTAVGESVTFVNVQDGTVLPIRVRKVVTAGTTASNILALY